MRILSALALTLALAACDKPAAPAAAPVEPAAAPAPAAMPLRLALDSEGLIAILAETGSTQPLPFSRQKSQTLVTMTRVEPAPGKESTNAECGAGPLAFVAWPDGLTLLFQDDRFAGWTVDAPGLTTIDGIGVGVTLAALKAAYPDVVVEESTLGTEFTAGALGGLLDGKGPDARVTNLWAGVTCMFR